MGRESSRGLQRNMLRYVILGLVISSTATAQWTELAEETREVTASNGKVYECRYRLEVQGDLEVNEKSWIRCKPDKRIKGVTATETFTIGDKQVELTHKVKKGSDDIVSMEIAPVPTTPAPTVGASNMTCQCKPRSITMYPLAKIESSIAKGGNYGASSTSSTALTDALTTLIGTFITSLLAGFLGAAVAGAIGRSVDPDMLAESELDRSAIIKSIETSRQLFGGLTGGSTSGLNDILMEQMMNQLLNDPELMNSIINSAIESGAIEQAVQSAIDNGVVENTIQSVIDSGVIEQQLAEMSESGIIEQQFNDFLASNEFEEALNGLDIEEGLSQLMEENSLMIEEMVAETIEEIMAEQMNNPDFEMMEQLLGNIDNAELGMECSCTPA